MTTDLAERRKGRALTLFLIAAGLIAVAAVTAAIEARSARPDQMSGPVVPGLADTIGAAQRINVVSSEASYRIEKTQRGWAMHDRGDFPVQAERLNQLTRGLAQMRYVRRMTSDAGRHERLGVGDPRADGSGILVQVENGERALLVDLIFSIEPGGRTYVRRASEDQVWEVRGAEAGEAVLPPLREVASWLNLRPLDMPKETLSRIEIMPAEGRAYILARADPAQPWRIASPALDAESQSMVTSTAEHLVEISPVDVVEAPAIQGTPRARLRASTFTGVAIDAELIEREGQIWLKLVARALAPEQETVALALNGRAAGWAYALSEVEAGALAPPLSSLLPSAQ